MPQFIVDELNRRFKSVVDSYIPGNLKTVSAPQVGKVITDLAGKLFSNIKNKKVEDLKNGLPALFAQMEANYKKCKNQKQLLNNLIALVKTCATRDEELSRSLAEIEAIRNDEEKMIRLFAFIKAEAFTAFLARLLCSKNQKEKLQEVEDRANAKIADIAASRAAQASYRDFGQIGELLINILKQLVQMAAINAGYDVDLDALDTGNSKRPPSFTFK